MTEGRRQRLPVRLFMLWCLMAGSGFGDPFWQLAEYCSVDKIA